MLTNWNKKVGKEIWVFNLPTGITCPPKVSCLFDCYDRKAEMRWPTVLPARIRNYKKSLTDTFVQEIITEINKKSIRVVRPHAAGDMYSPDYVEKWIEIARNCPDTIFYTYTKWNHNNLEKLSELRNFNLLKSILPDGDLNFGDENYIKIKHEKFGYPICPSYGSSNKKTCYQCKICFRNPYVLIPKH